LIDVCDRIETCEVPAAGSSIESKVETDVDEPRHPLSAFDVSTYPVQRVSDT